MEKKKILLKVSKSDPAVGYIYLDGREPGTRQSDKVISLNDLIGKYIGPSIYLDFDNNELIGIEIVG